MFTPTKATATIPAADLGRAKAFYAEKLGLSPADETDQEVVYRVGETEFVLFPSTGKASGEHTQLGLEVDDIDDAVASLREKGVVFEEYDLPGLTTVDGVAQIAGERAAWFKDSEGNLISVGQHDS